MAHLRPAVIRVISRYIHARPTAQEICELLCAHDALGKASATLNLGDALIAGERYLRAMPIRDRVLAEIAIGKELNTEIVKIIYEEPINHEKLKKLSADFKPIPWSTGEKIFIGTISIWGTTFLGWLAYNMLQQQFDTMDH